MTETNPDPIVRLARERLTTALISDALDSLGLIHQLMDQSIRPLDESLTLCGRARTGDYKDVYHAEHHEDPYEPQVALVDSLRSGDVVVMACGSSGRIQPWGELFSHAARIRGATGCVTDGLIRDVRGIRAIKFPAFCSGYGAMDARGRGILVATDIAVHCAGVWVSPGDLVFGDADGVVVIPRNVEEETIRKAVEMADLEREISRALHEGVSIVEIFRRYGTL
ncbi:MAG TPA: RraA family protein [bacterium]|nr:RraA family protein [bacterium]